MKVVFNVRCERNGQFDAYIFGSPAELGGGDATKGVKLDSVASAYQFRKEITFAKTIDHKSDWYAFCFTSPIGARTFDTIDRRTFPDAEGSLSLYDQIDIATGVQDLVVKFRIRCHTFFGQNLYLVGGDVGTSNWKLSESTPMYYEGFLDYWACFIRFPLHGQATKMEYKYVRATSETEADWEPEANHVLEFEPATSPGFLEVTDVWRWPDSELNTLTRAAFVEVVDRRRNPAPVVKIATDAAQPGGVSVHFSVMCPQVRSGQRVAVVGSAPELGGWNAQNSLALGDGQFPVWHGCCTISRDHFPLQYKYCIISEGGIAVEQGDSHETGGPSMNSSGSKYPATLLLSDWFINLNKTAIHGMGMYVPVFSLRTATSCGIGQYTDIHKLVDLCVKCGVSLVQILPINDTSDKGTWDDSYPYRQTSCFALHPAYIDLLAVPNLPAALKAEVEAKIKEFEALPEVDYPAVWKFKMDILKRAWAEISKKPDPAIKEFVEKNKTWLQPYAVYCFLRAQNGTSNFREWPKYSKVTQADLDAVCKEQAAAIEYTYWIQWLCDIQFKYSRDYATEQGVALKGDLPIGVYINSVECWSTPGNFNMDMCAGAPPDAFSADGQNWGFPTYNWDAMEKDGFAWWRLRLGRMAELFHALRVDHVLGFFRIWEIPRDTCVRGMLGHYNPCTPLTEAEVRGWGLHQDMSRYTEPYIRQHILDQKFGEYAEEVKKTFLQPRKGYDGDYFEFKPEYDNEVKCDQACTKLYADEKKRAHIRICLFELLANVILIRDPHHDGCYQVRTEVKLDHTMMTPDGPVEYASSSWAELPGNEPDCVVRMYLDFTYERQTPGWVAKANEKLKMLKDSTGMLICGEDLGQLTDGILKCLREHGLLSLRVQRMAKSPDDLFDKCEQYQYLSVCCPATHDSSVLRGWWEENHTLTYKFWKQELWRLDEPPAKCETWINEMIIRKHLWSNSMWAIFLLQDFADMFQDLRRQSPEDEQINIPADPHHHWRYRYPFTLEELCGNQKFCGDLRHLAQGSGRI